MNVFSRMLQIISSEGFFAVLKRGIAYIWVSLQDHGSYFIIEFNYNNEVEMPDVKPKIDCVYKPITSVSVYDELLAQGYRFGSRNFRPKLKKGAVAFCLFIDKVLASEAWAAADKNAKKAVDTIPFRVDFDKGEVCVGTRYTNPKYRRNGLSEYLYVMKLPYLKGKYIKGIASVNVNNKISQRVNEMFYGKVIARGRYFRFIRWHYWKEGPPRL